ncbi:MAG: hypothetical protein AAF329_18905, partial [Cyanobacteria bacterium P01_A01_bin.17]
MANPSDYSYQYNKVVDEGFSINSGKSGFSFGVITVAGTEYMVMCDQSAGTRIIDISTPVTPSLITTVGPNTEGYVSIFNQYAFVQSGNNSHTIDLSNPLTPVVSATYTLGSGNTPAQFHDIGGTDYMVHARDDFLEIYGIADPNLPNLVGSIAFDNSRDADGVAFLESGGISYLYVAQSVNNKFEVFDISTPATPISLTDVAGLNRPAGLAVKNIGGTNYLFLNNQNSDEFRVYDLSAP